jgi:cytochrome c553
MQLYYWNYEPQASRFIAPNLRMCKIRKRRRTGDVTVALRDQLTFIFVSLFATQAAVAAAQPADRAPDTMAARVLACASCHGTEGQGTSDEYFPRLAGKPAGYLYNQLIAFRDARRRYPPMNYLLEFLPDAYLKQIADHFAALRPPFPQPAPPVVSSEILAKGAALVTRGDPQRDIPACQGCHGPSFTGMEPAIPGLLGLRASYISAQLGAWRYGTRTATAPDCMQLVAGRLTEDDVKAIAAWLSSRPAPADPSPVAHGSLPMPLACGSEPN